MPKPIILRKWKEMSQGYLYDGPPKREDFQAILFVNNCEVRQRKGGTILFRRVAQDYVRAETKKAMEEKVAEFALRDDVRLLAKGIESNDFRTLPKEQRNPPPEIVEGTDDVYEQAEEVDLPDKAGAP